MDHSVNLSNHRNSSIEQLLYMLIVRAVRVISEVFRGLGELGRQNGVEIAVGHKTEGNPSPLFVVGVTWGRLPWHRLQPVREF